MKKSPNANWYSLKCNICVIIAKPPKYIWSRFETWGLILWTSLPVLDDDHCMFLCNKCS